jgi:glutathione synthase/RimK-type ligase-like ATP-grasp enzyme
VAIPLLLAATATKWASPARLPYELSRAGFDVALIAPKEALVAQSRFVANFTPLPDSATPRQWARLLAATVEGSRPRLIIPCDDATLHLLMLFVESPPEDIDAPVRENLRALIVESLGDPEHYRASIDKTLLPSAAAALGVRVPSHAVISDLAAARAFAAANGYPVVLKRAFGTAGQAVEIVREQAQLEPAFVNLSTDTPTMQWTTMWTSTQLLIQAWLPGRGLLRAVAAWRGVARAGMTREVLLRSSATDPSTVVRCRQSQEANRFAELLAAGFGISGFFGPEFIEHERTKEVYLIEINRRVTNGVQMGGLVGVDLCGALAAALDGRMHAGRTDIAAGEQHLIAEFPQEWLRDPESPYLLSARSDIPWNDPAVFRAMVAMRRGH